MNLELILLGLIGRRLSGIDKDNIYEDQASEVREGRSRLEGCLKESCDSDVVGADKYDWLGRNLRDLVHLVQGLADRGIELRVLGW